MDGLMVGDGCLERILSQTTVDFTELELPPVLNVFGIDRSSPICLPIA
jgi:hypothetical protein